MRPLHIPLVFVLLAYSSVVDPTASVFGGDQSTEELARQEYERLVELYEDSTFEQLQQHLGLAGNETERLSFDPETAAHYDAIRRVLKMTEAEQIKFKTNGLVVVDPKLRHSFGSAYYQIYASELPVLVTTDSVLYAWHRSYDNLLQELESQLLMPALAELLGDCHQQLAKQVRSPDTRSTLTSCEDVDLYLTVARNLLGGGGSQRWHGNLVVPSVFRMDDQAVERLADIKSLKLQTQYPRTESTRIYGGERYVDYSQFRPRGHYAASSQLQNYFRCMMWLGRADCGFNVLPVDPVAGIRSDWQRELRAAALLSQLVRDSDNCERLNTMSSIIQLLVGESDNLTVSGMLALFQSEKITAATELTTDSNPSLQEFADAIRASGLARQRIRSQSIVSNPYDTYKVPPPALFQMFGQVFTVDSLLLSNLVFDSIIFEGEKQRRMMPTGLDVAAALGNDYAVGLLEPQLRKWNYSANLLAGRDFVDQLQPQFWNGNVYHRWLGALRTLDDEPRSSNLPEVMQRPVWRAKQLQTQLASWSELRHDNVLYAKQSFTSVPGCQYPNGFVEPYPELYRRLGGLATATATRLGGLKVQPQQRRQRMQDRQIRFLNRFAEIMQQLEVIARQELDTQPMTYEQRRFIETTIDRRGSLPHGSGQKPSYDGWYCELLYNENDPSSWHPTIVDVHTNPRDHVALHVGVGDVNLAVVAVDSQDDVAAYVGPVYSYYEFTEAVEQRLDDRRWQQLIAKDELPPRPDWTKSFTTAPAKRTYDGLSVQVEIGNWVVIESTNGRLRECFRAKRNDEGLRELLEQLNARRFTGNFGISLAGVSRQGLQSLANVPRLAWVDFAESKFPGNAIEDFRRRRPDVEVLPGPFGVETFAVCRQIDGLRRFVADTSGELQPGEPLLLYVEPANVTWARRHVGLAAKLEVTATLVDASGAALVTHVCDPLELSHGRPGELVYTTMKMRIPKSLEPGVYKLAVECKDGLADPVRKAAADLTMEYALPP